MKKLRLFLTTILLAACGLALSGCNIKELGPTDEWVLLKAQKDSDYSIEYEYNESTKLKFDVYVNYASKDGETVTFNGNTKTLKSGFNVVIVPDADETNNEALKTVLDVADEADLKDICVFYSFGTDTSNLKSEDAEIDSTSVGSLTQLAWGFIYTMNTWDDTGTDFTKLIKKLTLLDKETNLDWKSILIDIAGGALKNF